MRIRDQKGFSLTEVVVAVGLLGGLSLVTMKLMQNQASGEKTVKSSGEINKTVGMILNAINNAETCRKMFSHRPAPDAAGADIDSLMIEITAGEYKVLLADNEGTLGYKNYGDFYIKDGGIKLYSTASTGIVELELSFSVKRGGRTGNFTTDAADDQVIKKRFPFEVTLDPVTGQVASCGPVLSEANEEAREKFCKSLDPGEDTSEDGQAEQPGVGVAYWDDLTDPANPTCKLNSMDCPWGEVPKEMTSLGGIICVPIADTVNDAVINQVFDTGTTCTTSTGAYTVESGADGRLRLVCP